MQGVVKSYEKDVQGAMKGVDGFVPNSDHDFAPDYAPDYAPDFALDLDLDSDLDSLAKRKDLNQVILGLE